MLRYDEDLNLHVDEIKHVDDINEGPSEEDEYITVSVGVNDDGGEVFFETSATLRYGSRLWTAVGTLESVHMRI